MENKIKTFIIDCSELMKEWDWDKNNELGLFPQKLLAGSNKKVWWLCKNKHNWQAKIVDRTQSHTSCPYCANKKIAVGFNDLATTHPQLVKEWHYYKNGDLLPIMVTKGSSKKVWWICNKNHEWYASIASRAAGRGCPICSNSRVLVGFNDLATTHPIIAKEWNFEKNRDLTPTSVLAGSSKKVWWICQQGHEWQTTISHRTERGHNCPFCSRRKAIPGQTDLATLNPKLAKEWHPTKNGDLTPQQVTVRSGKKIWWQCSNGHEWQATPHDRDTDNTNCPYCNARRQTSFPEQAILFYVKKFFPDAINKYKDIFPSSMELDIYIPSKHVGIEYDGANWHKTVEEHEREVKKYDICKKHGILLFRVKENTETTWKDVADQIYYVKKNRNYNELNRVIFNLLNLIYNYGLVLSRDPFYMFKNAKVDVVQDRVEIQKYLTEISDSLAIKRPDLVKEWNFQKNGHLKPEMFSLHSNESVWWKCLQCGYEWKSQINQRTKEHGSGCAKCGNVKKGKSFHTRYLSTNGSLAVNNLELAKEWHH